MAPEEVMDKVRSVIAHQFNWDLEKIGPTTVAGNVRGWDSLSHTILLLKVEEAFDIELPEEEVFTLKNVGELVDLVKKTLAGR